jgi:tetratricopeptide (TPR) repeat protein
MILSQLWRALQDCDISEDASRLGDPKMLAAKFTRSPRLSEALLALATLLVASAPAFASPAPQHDHAAASGAAAVCTANGFGKVHHPVQTSNPRAQRLFEQAMALDYGFNHGQAEQCFRRVAELDPNMPMAYWGIALVLGTNYNMPVDDKREKLAYEKVQKALALSANAPRNERDYIQALAKRYTDAPHPDYDRLEAAYHDAMREVYQSYPDDLDAATLFAESGMNLHPWQLYDRAGQPAPGTDEIVAVLESVLMRDPNHLGANHFYIHAVEASAHPEAALPSAQRLAALAPASGHLVHMPSHIYIRTGDHETGEKTNVAAVRVDDAYFAVAHPQGIYPLMYYTHNLHFIAAENAFMGNYSASLQAAKRVQEQVAPHLKEEGMLAGMIDFYYSLPLQVMARFHRWDDIMAVPQPEPSQPVTTVEWHYARALAAANISKAEQARNELAALKAAAPAMAKITTNSTGPHNSEVIPQMMSEIVEARLARAQHQNDTAIEHLQKAVSLEDTLDYNEPPDWLAPTHESLGAALLQAGKPTQAEAIFREDLKRNPRNPRSLFGLAEALKAEGKPTEAATVRQQFQRGWSKADTKLTLADF